MITSPHEARLTHADLAVRLSEFENFLADGQLAESAKFTYVDQAGRFLRWLAGDYTPRNAPAGYRPPTRRDSWTLPELREELAAYRAVLEGARLRPMAINTYVYSSSAFVHWLDGTYRSRGRRGPAAPTYDDDSWLDESSIQAHVVRWLQEEGWRILRQATGREHGTDIDAERGDERLAVEVKGHPRRLHVFGANKGQPRRWHPAAQARAYYGGALHTATTMLHTDPSRQVAIALPDLPVYRGLVQRSRGPLTAIGVQVWFVTQDGVLTDG